MNSRQWNPLRTLNMRTPDVERFWGFGGRDPKVKHTRIFCLLELLTGTSDSRSAD
jgi:hypothetical protein